MKKFYSLAIAALVAVSSVSAQGLKLHRFNADNGLSLKKVEKATNLSISETDKTIKNVAAKDIDIADISGTYRWTYTSMFEEDEGATITNAITITKAVGNNYTITYGSYSFGATFSMLTQSLSINANQNIGTHSQLGDVYLYHKQIANNQLTNSSAPLTATINGDSFEFGADEIIAIGNDAMGFFDAGYDNKFTVYTPVAWDSHTYMPENGWVDFGTATFADPFVITATSYSPADYAYTVAVEKNENVEGLYRLVNPYIGSPVAGANTDSEGEGYIAFSIANPNFVSVLPLVYCGFTLQTDVLLTTNLEGLNQYYYEATAEELLPIFEQNNLIPSSFDAETGKVTLLNCGFGTTELPDKCFAWNQTSVMEGFVQFNDWAGINGISVDNEDAPVEYYNLQGIRINNVENNPGLYIRKQGDKATKVFVK